MFTDTFSGHTLTRITLKLLSPSPNCPFKEGQAAVYLHATICGVEHFVSKPLDSIWSPGSNTDSQVC